MAIESTLLCMGGETEESIDSYISFTRQTSENMRKAFIYHYVKGMEQELACTISSVSPSNFTRDSDAIIEVARKIAAHNEIKYIKPDVFVVESAKYENAEKRIISREHAESEGLKNFFTGIECNHGHVSHRDVKTGTCRECNAIKARKSYRSKSDK